MAGYTFIGYAHENTRFALKVARRLRRHGITVWVDQWHVSQDEVWDREIARAIAGCGCFLIVLSPAAVNSWVVRQQVQWARQSGKTIISLLREPCELPEMLQGSICIDFTGRRFGGAFGQLLSHYFPDRALQTGTWTGLKQSGQDLVSEIKHSWHNTLRPLLWPGWLGPTVLAALAIAAVAFVGNLNSDSHGFSEPTPEALAVVQPTKPPTPSPTPMQTRTRAKDHQIMIEVPAGPFLMGSTDLDSSASPDEKPQRLVHVDTYWIDRTEITNRQFRDCVEAGGCKPQQVGNRIFREGNLPVVGVSWAQAESYCRWAGARLPTEAEWEKAARGTDGRLYPWGNKFEGQRLNYCDAACVADWRDRSANDGYRYTAPVGSYPHGASPYGVLDMSGNVWEWTADWYASGEYAAAPESNPTGPESGLQKVIRGGSWYYQGASLRVARRHKDVPTSSYDNIGFRCVVSEAEHAQWQPEQDNALGPSPDHR